MLNKIIEILFNTKANTAGASAAAKSLTDVQKQTEALRESEAEAARQAERDAQAAAQAEDTAAINRKANAMVFAQIGERAKQAAEGVRDFAKELAAIDPETSQMLDKVATGFDLASASAQGAAMGAAYGGPFGAAIGAVAMPGINLVRNEIEEAIKSAANLKQVEKIGENLQIRMGEVKAKMEMRAEIESWKKLTEQMQEALVNLERMAKSDAIKKEAQVKIAELDVRAANASGGDTATAEKNLLRLKEEELSSSNENKLKILIEKRAQAIIDVEAAYSELFGLNNNLYSLSVEEQAKAKKMMAELREKLKGLRAEVSTIESDIELFNEQQKAQGEVGSRQKQVDDLERGQDSTVQSLQTLVNDVEAKGGGGEAVQQAITALKKAMADSTLNPKELDDITLILARNRDNMLRLGVSFDVLDAVNKNMDALIGKLQAQKSYQEELSNRISRLEDSR